MRIEGKGETWTISCSAEEVAMILTSLQNNSLLQLEEVTVFMGSAHGSFIGE
jgi:hypothetical protein